MDKEVLETLEEIKRNTLLAAKNVLTADDVCLLTGISKNTLYKMTCNKQIPHYKPNAKLLFFDRKEIENWQRQNRVNTEREAEQREIANLINNKRK